MLIFNLLIKIKEMKKIVNQKKLSREQLRGITGNGPIFQCTYKCCDGSSLPLCPGYKCPAVVCPQ